jgi:primosomal protein N' (replication factor Y)
MTTLLKIAIAPFRHCFDYLAPPNAASLSLTAGMRVRVPFRHRETIGILVESSQTSDIPTEKLKTAIAVLDETSLISPTLFKMAQFASQYYHSPLSEVLLCALPTLLREGQAAEATQQHYYQINLEGIEAIQTSKRAPQQLAILTQLLQHRDGLSLQQLKAMDHSAQALNSLLKKNYVSRLSKPVQNSVTSNALESALQLNAEQQAAVHAVSHSLDQFRTFLLDGVTGSGKTEVYLQIVDQLLRADRQALILVPEINLTPQLIARFQQRFGVTIAALHSGLSDRERLQAWLMAKDGSAPIVIGTRSAIFTPLARPGIIIIDEEHDASFKQQEGFRYSARDLGIVRGRLENIPVVLGSATPSLESFYNAQQNRYQLLTLPERAGSAINPSFRVLDIRNQYLEHGLSQGLLQAIRQHLEKSGQVLLFLNRRGFSPTLICHACGWVANCKRCDARLTLHLSPRYLHCHHCSATQAVYNTCPACQSSNLLPIGLGTERLEQTLSQHFPDVPIARIDRDTTRRKGAMQKMLDAIHEGSSRILIGTQMLAKGHHFPNVTLVAIVNGDDGLYSTDFRASERTAQLLMQVAGRAGRADRPGEVLIQTHNPDHPLLSKLITEGYSHFTTLALSERQSALLPPYAHLALLRAEALQKEKPLAFLQEVKKIALSLMPKDAFILGPIPAPMEKRAGRFRAQLLLQSTQRQLLQSSLPSLIKEIESLKIAKRVRWSLDVDPIEMF